MNLTLSELSILAIGLGMGMLLIGLVGGMILWRLWRGQRDLGRTLSPLEQSGILPTAKQLTAFGDALHQLAGRTAVLEGQAKRQAAQLDSCLQRVGMVRYNPFGDTGGDQSFALALLDKAGSGVVLSSLHGRASTRVYAKPIAEGASTYQLTDEENAALVQSASESSTARE